MGTLAVAGLTALILKSSSNTVTNVAPKKSFHTQDGELPLFSCADIKCNLNIRAESMSVILPRKQIHSISKVHKKEQQKRLK